MGLDMYVYVYHITKLIEEGQLYRGVSEEEKK